MATSRKNSRYVERAGKYKGEVRAVNTVSV